MNPGPQPITDVPPIPVELGGMPIVGRLGEGGMGVVFKGVHPRLNIPVAVKRLNRNSTQDCAAAVREAQLAAKINHPNVVRVYDVQWSEEHFFVIIQEYVDGVSLLGWIERKIQLQQAISERRALEVAMDVARGLSAIHAEGIVHLDIKPENILLRRRDRLAKVADLGIARLVNAHQVPNSYAVSKVASDPGGTAGYMSPEQIYGQPPHPVSDVYALGVVLYEMLSGRHAFEGAAPHNVMLRQLREKPVPLATLRPDLDPLTVQVVEKSMEVDGTRRIQSASEVLGMLSEAHSRVSAAPYQPPTGGGISAPPSRPGQMTVLYVESGHLENVVRRTLEQEGLATTVVGDLESMRCWLGLNCCDVVLLNLWGWDQNVLAFEAVRSSGRNRQVPVLFLADGAAPEQIDEILSHEGTDLIVGPIGTSDLLARLRCLARMSQIQRERDELEHQYRTIRGRQKTVPAEG